MTKVFERSGVSFQYPDNWAVDVEDTGDGWTVTVQSPVTAFMQVSLLPEADAAGPVAEQALAALRAEYSGIEAEPAVDTLAGVPAVGHEIDFLTLDTAVTGWTRCIETTGGPLLVLCQTSEYDRQRNEPVLRALCASMTIVEG